MGDGRYYTYYQFFDVFITMILAMLAVGGLAYCYYRKNSKSYNLKFYIGICMIVFFAILRVIESVMPFLDLAESVRNIEVTLILILYLFVATIFNGWEISKIIYYSILILIPILTLCFKPFVQYYDFHQIYYTHNFKILFAIETISLYVLAGLKLHGHHVSKAPLTLWKYCLLVMCPATVYLGLLALNHRSIDYIEVGLMALLLSYIVLLFLANNESAYTLLAFDKMGDMGPNYIFVIDGLGQLVYKNKAVDNTNFFKNNHIIRPDKIAQMFDTDEVKSLHYHNNDYVELVIDQQKYYLSYKLTPLFEQGNMAGYIMTFTDITALLDLLMMLEDRHRQSTSIHHKLKKYSKVVYHTEKEREINQLLDEIIVMRDEQMEELYKMIQYAKNHLENESFEAHVNGAITKSNTILEEVRCMVTKYRKHYGG